VSGTGRGEVNTDNRVPQPGVVQQRGREQHLAIHVDPLKAPDRHPEEIGPVRVVEQSRRQQPDGLPLGRDRQDRRRLTQGIAWDLGPATRVEASQHRQSTDGVDRMSTGQCGKQGAPVGGRQLPARARHPGLCPQAGS